MNTVMTRGLRLLFVLVLFSSPVAGDQVAGDQTGLPVLDLGNGRYRVGPIEIDKEAQRFTVTGTTIMLAEDAPIEFLAVARGGHKSYEALLELDSTAVEFNLACILIGLDADHASPPSQHFDQTMVTGDVVNVRVSWVDEGREQTFEIERLLRGTAEPKDHVWVYTGSYFAQDGTYMASRSGNLIGFVHDPESIIQHQKGLGLGEYGAITYDPDVMPRELTLVTVSVSRNPE